MYQEGVSPRGFAAYDTTMLVERKRRELGLHNSDDVSVQEKGNDMDQKKLDIAHVEYGQKSV